MTISVKICGIDRIESVDMAVEKGAAYLGFVFYKPSPRNLTLEKAKKFGDIFTHRKSGLKGAERKRKKNF